MMQASTVTSQAIRVNVTRALSRPRPTAAVTPLRPGLAPLS
jgi:hypothetical protein